MFNIPISLLLIYAVVILALGDAVTPPETQLHSSTVQPAETNNWIQELNLNPEQIKQLQGIENQ